MIHCFLLQEFLLKRKNTAASKFWPKSLSKQHINGLGLWDPVSFCKYVAKEEKLKRSKKAGEYYDFSDCGMTCHFLFFYFSWRDANLLHYMHNMVEIS